MSFFWLSLVGVVGGAGLCVCAALVSSDHAYLGTLRRRDRLAAYVAMAGVALIVAGLIGLALSRAWDIDDAADGALVGSLLLLSTVSAQRVARALFGALGIEKSIGAPLGFSVSSESLRRGSMPFVGDYSVRRRAPTSSAIGDREPDSVSPSKRREKRTDGRENRGSRGRGHQIPNRRARDAADTRRSTERIEASPA